MKHKFSSLLALCIAMPALMTPARAQQAFDLGPITLFTNQTATAVARSGATVEVVEAPAIRAATDTRLVDFLSDLPGVSATTNGGLGGTGSLRVRGLGGQYLAVRIDGIDVTDASQTQTLFDFGSLTLGNVARIELLKGSQSASYGANAVGGVINITTLGTQPEGTSGQAMLEIGSNRTAQTALSLGLKADRLEMNLGLSGYRTDGISALAAGTEADGATSARLTFAAAYQATDTLRLGIAAFAENSSADYDPQFYADPTLTFSIPRGDGFTFDEAADLQQRGARVFAELDTGAITQKLSLSRFTSRRDFVGSETRLIEDFSVFPSVVTGSYVGGDGNFNSDRDAVDYTAEWAVSDRTQVNFGLQWKREGFTATEQVITAVPPSVAYLNTAADVTQRAAFAEVLYAPSDTVDVALALRQDDHSVFGAATTGRLALAWRIQPDLILRASAATGYRAPSLYELNSQSFGNLALNPEESRSFEIGLEQKFGDQGFVKATLFDTEVTNRIDYDFLTNRYQQAVGETRIRGLELSGRVAVTEKLALLGSYTLTDAVDPVGAPVVRVPRHDLHLGLEAALTPRLSGRLTVNRVAGRFESAFPSPAPVADYTTVNLGLRYAISDQTEAYLRVENLFDADYQSVQNYNTLGRAAYFGVRTSF